MILEEIAEKTRERIGQQKRILPLGQLKERLFDADNYNENCRPFPFEEALKKPGLSLVCEVKKASPSKGIIAQDFPYLQIAKEYEAAGADAISVLTEPYYFLGENRYLEEIAKAVSLPVLRKDFIVDEYMIYEAKLLGASAVLLICALLQEEELLKYQQTAHSLGLSALVEAHTEEEVETALKCHARIIGVNNRNLKDFTVDTENSVRLRKLVPKEVLFLSESGIRTPEDMEKLRRAEADGVLIGEAMMRSGRKQEFLKTLQGSGGR